MANLIKQPTPRPARSDALPFEDLSRRAERCLEEARDEAHTLRTSARREIDALRAQCIDELRREAEVELEQRVAVEVERRLSRLAPAYQAASQKLAQAGHEAQAAAETACLRVAVALAERIIRRELRHSADIPLALIREALELAGSSPRVRLFLNPADELALRPQLQSLLAGRAERNVEVLSDATTTPGGCRVETTHGIIDQQIETQLRRMFEELTAS